MRPAPLANACSPTRNPLASALRAVVLASVAASLGASLAGCVVVKPYERETLSLRCMSQDAERTESKFRQHWQESRAGATGGYAAAGGGCGCN